MENDSFETVRKARRSFEEKLRKDLLALEQEGKARESKSLLHHLGIELYRKMSELTRGGRK